MATWTGTVSVEDGSPIVTVVSGDALTDLNCSADTLVALDGVTYFVLSRTDTTSFELTRAYEGDGASPTVAVEVTAEIFAVNQNTASMVNLATILTRVQSQLSIFDKNSQGFFYTFIGATGNSDPGAGKVALSTTDFGSLSSGDDIQIYLDNIDGNDRSVAALLDTLAVGTIIVIRSLSSTAYVSLELSASVTDQTGYRRGLGSYVGHDGTIASDEPVTIAYYRVGEGLHVDAQGVFADRATHEGEAAGFTYLSTNGDGVTGIPTIYRLVSSDSPTEWSVGAEIEGDPGNNGWSPRLAIATDGDRRVLQLAGYVGGEGTEPTTGVGQYITSSGLSATIGDAVDIRGAEGLSAYEIAVADGFVGDETAWLASLVGVGNDGADGDDGADGTDPGILLIWDEGTSNTNLGSGKIWANDTLDAATLLFVSKTARNGVDISEMLEDMMVSTNTTRKSNFVLSKSGGGAMCRIGITGLTDHTGYVEFAIASSSSPNADPGFITSDLISLQDYQVGNKGSDGAGAGDVVGPAEDSVTDNELAAFDSTTGKLIKGSGVLSTQVVQKDQNLGDLTNPQAGFDSITLRGADIASGATVNLDTATGSLITITGTATTTAFTLTSGRRRRLVAAAAWPITASATVVIKGVSSGETFTCAVGDELDVWKDDTIVRITPHRKSGKAVVASAFSEVSSKPTTIGGYGITDAGPTFDTLTLARAYSTLTAPDTIHTRGYAAPGDGGGATYKKVAAEPSHPGKFYITIADGSSPSTLVWYEFFGDSVNLFQLGAKGDDTISVAGTDDTTAFTNAVAVAIALGIPLEIPSLPSGRMIRLTAPVVVNKGIKIVGAGASHNAGGSGGSSTPLLGSWLHFDHTGIGLSFYDSTNLNAIGFSCVGVGVWRNQPANTAGAWTATANDFDFEVKGTTYMADIFCLRSTKGIYVNLGILTVDGLRGQFFDRGIEYLISADVNRLTNLHFWPYWGRLAGVKAYSIANLICLFVNRCDGLHVHDAFGYWCHRLMKFDDAGSAQGSAVAGFQLSSIYADACGGGIEITSTDAANTRGCYGHIEGLLINADTAGSGRGLYVAGTNISRVTVNGLHVTRANQEAIRSEGAAHVVSVGGVGYLEAWAADGGGESTFAVSTGARITFDHQPKAAAGTATYSVASNSGSTGGIFVAGKGNIVSRTYTIASGVITITDSDGAIVVDTEASAATDDLDTINGGIHGQLITISSSSSSRDPTLKDNTGNLILAGDCALATNSTVITLRNIGGSQWREVARSVN